VSMLKRSVRARKLHLLLGPVSKVRQLLRCFISLLNAVYIYLGLSKDDIERHIKYVGSDTNFAAKSSQCEKRINNIQLLLFCSL
jgi:hypothetical protein